jgi:hypothetical protein
MLDFSACFPTSVAYTLAKAFASTTDTFACMLIAAAMAAMPATNG